MDFGNMLLLFENVVWLVQDRAQDLVMIKK